MLEQRKMKRLDMEIPHQRVVTVSSINHKEDI
jgi:ribosomal protein S25